MVHCRKAELQKSFGEFLIQSLTHSCSEQNRFDLPLKSRTEPAQWQIDFFSPVLSTRCGHACFFRSATALGKMSEPSESMFAGCVPQPAVVIITTKISLQTAIIMTTAIEKTDSDLTPLMKEDKGSKKKTLIWLPCC